MKRIFLIGILAIASLMNAQGGGLAEAALLAEAGADAAPAPFVRWIYVNPNRFGTAAGSPWNDVSAASNSTGAKATNLNNASAVATTVDINMTVATTTQFFTTPGGTGSNSGPFPDNAQQRGWGSTTSFTFEIQQLSASTEYKLEFFASLEAFQGNTASFTVNGVGGTYTSLANNTTTLYTVETTSDGSGVITVTIAPGDGTTASLCAFVISKR